MNFVGLIAAVLVLTGGALDGARAQRRTAAQALSAADAQVAAEQGQLDAVSKRIEELKAQRQASPGLFVPAQLDALLKQSQALSERLVALHAEQARTREAEASARAALARELESQLAADRAALSSKADAGLVQEIRALEAERAELSAKVSTAAGPEVRFEKPSDDPRELRERADALRDRADKVARQQAQVEVRIHELEDQAELDRQLSRFGREDALFDEGDRRVHVSRAEQAAPAPAAAPADTLSPASRTTGPTVGSTPPQHSKQGGTGGSFGSNGPTAGVNAAGMDSTPSVGATPSARIDLPGGAAQAAAEVPLSARTGELVRPGELASGAGVAASPEEADSLADLRSLREKLGREQAALRQQAAALEAGAR